MTDDYVVSEPPATWANRFFSKAYQDWEIDASQDYFELIEKYSPHKLVFESLTDDEGHEIAKVARSDRHSWQEIRGLVTSRLRSGANLPGELAILAAEYIDGGNPFSRPGRRTNETRDVFIATMVATLVDKWGLPATRNKATDHACAASIVADVMGKHGVTESAVAKIWTRLGKNIDVLFRTT